VLRCANVIGPDVDTAFTRMLSLPVVPMVFGFDPRLQFVHELDAVDALVAAIKNPVRGPVNVAAPGTIGLTKLVRMAGKPTLPLLPGLFGPVTDSTQRLGIESLSADFRRLLRFGRGIDITRLVEEVGYMPRFTTVQAVEDYVRTQRGRRLVPVFREAVAS
jgi:UDP-glucose 4-epimerase